MTNKQLKTRQYRRARILKDRIKTTVRLWTRNKRFIPTLFLYGLVFVYSGSNSALATSLQQKPGVLLYHALLGDKYETQIYVPDTGGEQQRFPVLYIMDGQHYMHSAIGIQHSLTHRNASLAKFIVVAIDTSTIGDASSERQSLLTAQSDNLINLIGKKLIPLIDTQFPSTGENVYFGWEFAAGFGLDLMMSHPVLFDGFLLASSPTYTDERISRLHSFLKQNSEYATSVYLTLGQKEDYAIEAHNRLNQLLSRTPNVKVKYSLSNQYDHYTTPIDALSNGLRWYFSDFSEIVFYDYEDIARFGGVKGVEAYYLKRAARYGTPKKPANNTLFTMARHAAEHDDWETFQLIINKFGEFEIGESAWWNSFFGRFYLQHNEINKAKTLFKKGLLKQQNSHQIWAALGDVNHQLNLLPEAMQAYEKAIKYVDNDESLREQYLLKLNKLKLTH